MKNMIQYCELSGKAGFGEDSAAGRKTIDEDSSQIRNDDLPEQPVMQKYEQPKVKVTKKDLVYVNSFAELVDEALKKPEDPAKQE